jgi:hypothetical protein
MQMTSRRRGKQDDEQNYFGIFSGTLQMTPLTRNLAPRFHLKVRGREGEENQAGEKEHEKQNAILKTKVILCMHATR